MLRELRGRQVLVVGPVAAPARAAGVDRVDHLLATECAAAGVAYLSVTGLDLSYQADQLHLTPASHRRLGDVVANRVDQIGH